MKKKNIYLSLHLIDNQNVLIMYEKLKEFEKKKLAKPTINSQLSYKNSELSPPELKVYIRLSLEFQVIMSASTNYQSGMFAWSKILPSRLEKYGLNEEEWERISGIGDNNEEIQRQLRNLSKDIEPDEIDRL